MGDINQESSKNIARKTIKFLQLSMLNIGKFYFGDCSCQKTFNFSKLNCHRNNFLHYDFHFSM